MSDVTDPREDEDLENLQEENNSEEIEETEEEGGLSDEELRLAEELRVLGYRRPDEIEDPIQRQKAVGPREFLARELDIRKKTQQTTKRLVREVEALKRAQEEERTRNLEHAKRSAYEEGDIERGEQLEKEIYRGPPATPTGESQEEIQESISAFQARNASWLGKDQALTVQAQAYEAQAVQKMQAGAFSSTEEALNWVETQIRTTNPEKFQTKNPAREKPNAVSGTRTGRGVGRKKSGWEQLSKEDKEAFHSFRQKNPSLYKDDEKSREEWASEALAYKAERAAIREG